MNKEVFLSAMLLDSLIFIKGRQVFYTKIKIQQFHILLLIKLEWQRKDEAGIVPVCVLACFAKWSPWALQPLSRMLLISRECEVPV